jgi:hypothetical protein
MKFVIVVAALAMSAPVFAAECTVEKPLEPKLHTDMLLPKPKEICGEKTELPRSTPKDEVQEARSGCCSHHGGVCGCGGTNAACCDGTFSPTCGC